MTHNFWIHCPPKDRKSETQDRGSYTNVHSGNHGLQKAVHMDGWTGCLIYVYQWVPVGPNKVEFWFMYKRDCLLNGPGRRRQMLTDCIHLFFLSRMNKFIKVDSKWILTSLGSPQWGWGCNQCRTSIWGIDSFLERDSGDGSLKLLRYLISWNCVFKMVKIVK